MYSVLRRYRVRLGTVGEAAAHVERSLLPLLKHVPGFVAHYTMDAGNNTITSLTLFATADGAEASTLVLREWFRSDWPSFQQMPPETSVGQVLLQGVAGRDGAAVAAGERADGLPVAVASDDGTSEDRRAKAERRALSERRMAHERRETLVPVLVERRVGHERRVRTERRGAAERRLGVERRAGARPPLPAWLPLVFRDELGSGAAAERPAWVGSRPSSVAPTG